MKESKKIKVYIVGSHGVPAKYGGLETLADFFCQYLASKYDITVFCTADKYPEREKEYMGAKLIYVPIAGNGFKGIFYDVFTYIYACFKADVILYLSPVGSGFITPLRYLFNTKVVVNHGGLDEWEREKLSFIEKKFAKFNHRVASRTSNVNIADNIEYKNSLRRNFNADSVVIRYGGDHANITSPEERPDFAKKYPFVNEKYAVSFARAQVDNNLHIALETFEKFTDYKLALVSNWTINQYGKDLYEKYKNNPNIILLDPIYNKEELDFVRCNGFIYIHTHSRCGTAPTLVEAMNSDQPIICFDVPTNRETTHNKSKFFTTSSELLDLLTNLSEEELKRIQTDMYTIGKEEYTWKRISQEYENVINPLVS